MATDEQGSFTVDIEDHMRESLKMLDYMRKNSMLCDVILVANNVEIPAHKSVLASCSPYFFSMFTNTETAKQETIELDVSPDMLLLLINYMYSSRLCVSEQQVKDVLEVANMLLLSSVKRECCNTLKRIMHPRNCLSIKLVATACGDSGWTAGVSSYIDAHFVDVIASDEFLNLTNIQLSELISRDTVSVPSEEKVYECVVRWINYNPKERRKYLRPLMNCVRLPFISRAYLKQYVVKNNFLKGDTYCKDLIINALLEDDTTTLNTTPRKYWTKTILVVGGYGREALNSLEYYDFNTGNWSDVLQIPFGISAAGIAAVNQNVYIVGGIVNGCSVSSVNRYDICMNSWHEVVNMTTERSKHGVTALGNCIYAIGGWNGADYLNSAEKFDLETQTWIPIEPMFHKKCGSAVSFLDNILYVVGGSDGNNPIKSVECYDPLTNTWRKLCNMHQYRSGVGICTLDRKIFAIGGYNGREWLRTVEVYSPNTDNWTEIAPMNITRWRPGVEVVNNRIYVIGGHDGQNPVNSIEMYDRETNVWILLPKRMNVARHGHAVVTVERPT